MKMCKKECKNSCLAMVETMACQIRENLLSPQLLADLAGPPVCQ